MVHVLSHFNLTKTKHLALSLIGIANDHVISDKFSIVWLLWSLGILDNYRNLLVNSCSLHSSHPWIIAAGCSANTVINA